jgi:hypothetical protein
VVPPKTWLAIPIMAIVCAALGFACHHEPPGIVAIGALAAATAAAVRAFAGASVAAAIASAAAALLATLGVLELPALEQLHPDLPRTALAAAAAMFAIAELARPLPVDASPLPAIGAALVAGVLDPAYVALFAIAGVRFLLGPWTRPRWAAVIPIIGTLAIGIAVLAGCARSGVFAELWHVWTARSGTTSPLELLAQAGDTLGPIAAIAAFAGLGLCTLRGRYAAAAVGSVAVAAVAVDLASGTLGAATISIAALGAGVGLARLAATVRWPTGQSFVGATAGFMIVVAPAMLRW